MVESDGTSSSEDDRPRPSKRARTRLKPNLMIGGYGQFTYHFNYWGPIAPNRDTHVIVKRMDKVVF